MALLTRVTARLSACTFVAYLVAVALLWLTFTQAYVTRIGQSVLFAALALVLVVAFAGYVVRDRPWTPQQSVE